MASLVADYSSSSGSESDADIDRNSESSDSESSKEEDVARDSSDEISASNNKLPLPTPDFDGTTLKTSVFKNPFVEAEKAKSAILEKHVKMTPTLDDVKMINGRKICWNYRKGRCRFGHNCTFAHDSDLHRSARDLDTVCITNNTVICQSSQNALLNVSDDEEVDQENNQTLKRKKRPGLCQTLVPGKKVMKIYKAQKLVSR